MKKYLIPFFSSLIFLSSTVLLAQSTNFLLPAKWAPLKPILSARLSQKKPKMKLNEEQVNALMLFLNKLKTPVPQLENLQQSLPKTTLELLRAVQERGLSLTEAEKMADYLKTLIYKFKFANLSAFDENTSHIIGRDWSQIDYSGENMTWQKQQQKYLPYGIVDFKSVDSLRKFFPIESQLPYFEKIYRPKNPRALAQ